MEITVRSIFYRNKKDKKNINIKYIRRGRDFMDEYIIVGKYGPLFYYDNFPNRKLMTFGDKERAKKYMSENKEKYPGDYKIMKYIDYLKIQ